MWGWREGQLYKSIVVSSKNKYEPVMDDGSVETKGLAIAKKATIPIAKHKLFMKYASDTPLSMEMMVELPNRLC
ncbi:hypothetical protein FOXYSP1_07111 [Fusarium oxysporum f. sp. phaseoli]